MLSKYPSSSDKNKRRAIINTLKSQVVALETKIEALEAKMEAHSVQKLQRYIDAAYEKLENSIVSDFPSNEDINELIFKACERQAKATFFQYSDNRYYMFREDTFELKAKSAFTKARSHMNESLSHYYISQEEFRILSESISKRIADLKADLLKNATFFDRNEYLEDDSLFPSEEILTEFHICGRKKAYTFEKDAWANLGDPSANVYLCVFCTGYHQGHSQEESKSLSRRIASEYYPRYRLTWIRFPDKAKKFLEEKQAEIPK
jgi:hypothetical protein